MCRPVSIIKDKKGNRYWKDYSSTKEKSLGEMIADIGDDFSIKVYKEMRYWHVELKSDSIEYEVKGDSFIEVIREAYKWVNLVK